ncbi:aldose epimerase family protein [Litoribacter populi]|uniref:hypothetical protein n=1 Tax=Litoribacter populi TaxID=2598460 RepID=UPI001180D7A4|nr:hypothetical protein [Litoribacter populi]
MVKEPGKDHDSKIVLRNGKSTVTLELNGGAISGFQFLNHKINPLNFRFNPDQMPSNNRGGYPYQGHFLCLGRWGEPSKGEIMAGLPNHGQVANIKWDKGEQDNLTSLMSAVAPLEGLRVERKVSLDPTEAVFGVAETITNINPLGRASAIVQHPTLTFPFLDEGTQVNCSAKVGFQQSFDGAIDNTPINWPLGKLENGNEFSLECPKAVENAVYSFICSKEDNLGWITAYSPTHQLLLGYMWKREDYPWIHLWQHFEEGIIKYRGIEFGTAGVHKPFGDFIHSHPVLFGEKTFDYLDAGACIHKKYVSFQMNLDRTFEGVEDVSFVDGIIQIKEKRANQILELKTSLGEYL